jgi:hypothetical protein
LLGVVTMFAGPALVLAFDHPAIMAASLGYLGISLFTAGVAASYGFATHERPWMQLLKNMIVAAAVSGLFFGVYLVL